MALTLLTDKLNLCYLFVFTFYALLDAADAGQYCYEYYNQYYDRYWWCEYGCCGDYYNQSCCDSNAALIAGIVIGSLFGLAILIGIIVCLVCMVKKKKNGGSVIRPANTNTRVVRTTVYPGPPSQAQVPQPPPYSSYQHTAGPPIYTAGIPPGMYGDPAYPPPPKYPGTPIPQTPAPPYPGTQPQTTSGSPARQSQTTTIGQFHTSDPPIYSTATTNS